MKFTTAFAFTLAAVAQLVSAAPTKRDVWDPKVTFPTQGTSLQSGETITVTWETTDMPVEITNTVGHITLNFGNTATPVVLAQDFDIRSGHAVITVPDVYTASDYSIDLFGDSGNWSEQFEIQGFNPFAE